MLTWNDHHLVLVLARAGTVAGAARALGVNETTISRRLAAAELAAGSTLFRRIERKLEPTAAGRAIVEAGEAMERALAASGTKISSAPATVRVSTVMTVIEHMIAPRLSEFVARHPGIVMELVGSNETVSLARREADISIRLQRPERGRLVARRIGRMRFILAGREGTDPTDFIAYERDMDALPEIATIMARFGNAAPVARIVSLSSITRAVQRGLGAAMLPECMIATTPGVVALDPSVHVERPLWLVVHEDMKERPAVRSAVDWLSDTIHNARPGTGELPHTP